MAIALTPPNGNTMGQLLCQKLIQVTIAKMKKDGWLLTHKSSNFAKLSRTDKLVCLDIISRNRKELQAWLLYIARSYVATGTNIDVGRLIEDIENFERYAKEMNLGIE